MGNDYLACADFPWLVDKLWVSRVPFSQNSPNDGKNHLEFWQLLYNCLYRCLFILIPTILFLLQLCNQSVSCPFHRQVLGMWVSLAPWFKLTSNHYLFEDLDLKEEIWYFLVTPTPGDMPGLYLHPHLFSGNLIKTRPGAYTNLELMKTDKPNVTAKILYSSPRPPISPSN